MLLRGLFLETKIPVKEDKLTIDCETPKATFRATWLLALLSSMSKKKLGNS